MATKPVLDKIRNKYGFKVTWVPPDAVNLTEGGVSHQWRRPPDKHTIIYDPNRATDQRLLEKAQWMDERIADGTAECDMAILDGKWDEFRKMLRGKNA